MKINMQWMLATILICSSCVFTSCTNDSKDTPSQPEQPEKTYSASTRELITLVNSNAQLKSLLEKAIAKGVEINPDRETNPAQTLSEYYDFVEWAAHAMPWTVINQPEGTDIFTRIDQSLNYFFFINDIPLRYSTLSPTARGSRRLPRHGAPILTQRIRGIRRITTSWQKRTLSAYQRAGMRILEDIQPVLCPQAEFTCRASHRLAGRQQCSRVASRRLHTGCMAD
jgi:hypothetical protein